MKILFTGDIVLNNNLFSLSPELEQLFKECDFRICNMEAPIANPKINSPIIKTGPAIYQTEIILEQLNKYSFSHVSLANNHILDYGTNALKSTIEEVSNYGIIPFGAGFGFKEAYDPIIIEIGSKRIAIFAFSQAEFGVYKNSCDSVGYAWINHPDVNNIIREAKRNYDYVFVMAHAGLEDVPYPLPEWRARYRELIDIGVDCIIGSHPHISQGVEEYKGKNIFYSLGNFFFELPNIKNKEEGNKGTIVTVTITDTLSFETIPIHVENNIINIDKREKTIESLNKRSEILKDNEAYLSEINKIASDFWSRYYNKYYLWNSNIGIKACFKNLIKSILNKITKRRYPLETGATINTTFLLHNIQIETHRWIVERYLYNKNKIDNNF